jgi:hypothetical protein
MNDERRPFVPPDIKAEQFAKTLRELLEETFEKVHGIFLDPDTSLFGTLDGLSAQEASKAIIPRGTTIAGHTEHVRFYLQVTEDYMRSTLTGRIDWGESWRVSKVSPEEWEALRRQLREMHGRILALVDGVADWNDERALGGAMGILSHTAYHLGAIRQLARAVKAV